MRGTIANRVAQRDGKVKAKTVSVLRDCEVVGVETPEERPTRNEVVRGRPAAGADIMLLEVKDMVRPTGVGVPRLNGCDSME